MTNLLIIIPTAIVFALVVIIVNGFEAMSALILLTAITAASSILLTGFSKRHQAKSPVYRSDLR